MKEKLNIEIKSFMDLKHHDKVIDIHDDLVMEFYVWDGDYYLATDRTLFALAEFNENDFLRYFGEHQVGDYDFDYVGEYDCENDTSYSESVDYNKSPISDATVAVRLDEDGNEC